MKYPTRIVLALFAILGVLCAPTLTGAALVDLYTIECEENVDETNWSGTAGSTLLSTNRALMVSPVSKAHFDRATRPSTIVELGTLLL